MPYRSVYEGKKFQQNILLLVKIMKQSSFIQHSYTRHKENKFPNFITEKVPIKPRGIESLFDPQNQPAGFLVEIFLPL